MSSRSNACTELTRFWLEARHGCLVSESIPVPVHGGQSDLDLVAIEPRLSPFAMPDGTLIGPRLVIETKDEHDWEPHGREFGKLLRQDASKLGTKGIIPREPRTSASFSMLRQAHFEAGVNIFGNDDFDRLFVVHAMDPTVLVDLAPSFRAHRIHWLTLPDLVRDLRDWYQTHPRPSGLRHTLMGDIWHLLVGFCGFRLPSPPCHE